MRLSARRYRVLLALLLCSHAALLFGISRTNYVTIDEMAHVPAGMSHWLTGRFDAYRVNPHLSRLVAALPVLAAKPNIDFAWTEATPIDRSEWTLSKRFKEANFDRHFDLYRLARLPGIGWSLLAAVVIARWSRESFGKWSGLLAAALWCFDPLVLGFAAIVTPDVPSAAMGVTAAYAYWRYLLEPSRKGVFLCGTLLGLALLTKSTLLLLYALWPSLALLIQRKKRPDDRHLPGLVVSLAMMFAISVLVINCGYLFRGSGKALGSYQFVSSIFTGAGPPAKSYGKIPGNRFATGPLKDFPVPLPEDFIQGIDVQRRDFESGFPSYLDGVWRNWGWWHYYVHAFCVKAPTGWLALIALATVLAFKRTRRPSRAAFLFTAIIAAAFFGFVSSQTGFNHHLRYVLPAYPFLMIATSRLCDPSFKHRRLLRTVVAALVAWGVLSSLAVYPHSMSHFNEISGGALRGDEHLVDSNIDWGQDLTFLKTWLVEHPEAQPIGLSYFGRAPEGWLGVKTRDVPPVRRRSERSAAEPWAEGPVPGYFAVSVHHLRGGSMVQPSRVRKGPIELEPGEGVTYFQFFKPIARAGYSIRIYHITKEQADEVRNRLGLPKLP